MSKNCLDFTAVTTRDPSSAIAKYLWIKSVPCGRALAQVRTVLLSKKPRLKITDIYQKQYFTLKSLGLISAASSKILAQISQYLSLSELSSPVSQQESIIFIIWLRSLKCSLSTTSLFIKEVGHWLLIIKPVQLRVQSYEVAWNLSPLSRFWHSLILYPWRLAQLATWMHGARFDLIWMGSDRSWKQKSNKLLPGCDSTIRLSQNHLESRDPPAEARTVTYSRFSVPVDSGSSSSSSLKLSQSHHLASYSYYYCVCLDCRWQHWGVYSCQWSLFISTVYIAWLTAAKLARTDFELLVLGN